MRRYITVLFLTLLGCGSALPRPATSPHTPDEFIEVPFPPPAVRANLVPDRPHVDSLWIDGEWRWQGSRWAWRRGNWVIPPAGATLAPAEIRRSGTQLRHAESVFHLVGGGSLDPSELRERRRRVSGNTACSSPEPASFEQRAVWPP